MTATADGPVPSDARPTDRRWRPRARTRLTLWYALLMTATIVLFGVASLMTVGRVLDASLDENLSARAQGIEAAVAHELHEGERLDLGDLQGQIGGLEVVRLWDARGRLVFGLEEGSRLPPGSRSAPALGGDESIGAERLSGGTAVRIVARPLRSGRQIVGIVQVGRSTAEIDGVLSALRLAGLAGLGVAVAVAAVGGAFLARRALVPVARVTREANAIGAGNLSRRLGLDLPDDEMGQLARAFDAMIARLESAFERQQRFTADASHELRTPLGIIRSQVDVALGQRRSPDEYEAVLRGIRAEVDRLAGLADRLLTLARAEGRESLSLVPVDLQDLVAEAGSRIAARARDLGIVLDVAVHDVPEIVGDPIWLAQLLANLLDNALRHTPRGGRVRLTLAAAAGDEPTGALIGVEDTGEGIAPEHLPHLFERFYRTDTGRARADGGAGLGLAICAWVAHAHGGTISVSSEVGVGSRFAVWLPAAPGTAPGFPDGQAREGGPAALAAPTDAS